MTQQKIDANDFDIAAAIYWFANDYHGGQSSNLYSALSTSDYRPGPMHKSIKDDENETATQMYQELVNEFGGNKPEVDKSQWMGMSMNEKKPVNVGVEDESVQEDINYPSTGEYKGKVEKIKQTMDNLFNDEYYDVIDILFKLLVTREKGAGKIAALKEIVENYADHLDTNYSADGMEDANEDKDLKQLIYDLYDAGKKTMNAAKNSKLYDSDNKNKLIQVANMSRQMALEMGVSLGWGEAELPPYD